VDVTRGKLGYFSELKVRNNHMDGYVKVLFTDLDVYDPEQDKEKPFFRKAYEFLADGVADLMENRATEDTATKTSISGPLESPSANIMEIIGNLIRNAFFDAILPGLERERARLTGSRIGPDRGGDDKKPADSKRDDRDSDKDESGAGRSGERPEAKR
jgi:hypothetical protein